MTAPLMVGDWVRKLSTTGKGQTICQVVTIAEDPTYKGGYCVTATAPACPHCGRRSLTYSNLSIVWFEKITEVK